MKVIFLDIDGVLNSKYSIMRNFDSGMHLRYTTLPYIDHVICLNEITNKTGAKLVVNSVREERKNIQDLLYLSGVIADTVGVLSDAHDGLEEKILNWLDCMKHTEETIESFIILGALRPKDKLKKLVDRFVRTDQEIGLTPDEAEKAITLLNDC